MWFICNTYYPSLSLRYIYSEWALIPGIKFWSDTVPNLTEYSSVLVMWRNSILVHHWNIFVSKVSSTDYNCILMLSSHVLYTITSYHFPRRFSIRILYSVHGQQRVWATAQGHIPVEASWGLYLYLTHGRKCFILMDINSLHCEVSGVSVLYVFSWVTNLHLELLMRSVF